MKRFLNLILISGAAVWTVATAHGSTLKFNGTNAHVLLENSVTRFRFVTTSPFSIEAWVKVNSLSAFQTIVAKYNANVYGEYYVGINTNGRVWFQREAAPNFILISSNSVPAGLWTHVAVTYANGTRRIYINGQLDPVVDPGSGPNPTGGPNTVLLGAQQVSGAPVAFLNGELDEVRFWNTTRSASQIQTNLNRALNGDEPGLLAYYRFEEAGGLYAVDGTRTSLAGVLTNGAVWNSAFDALPRPIANSRPATLVTNTSAQLNGFVNTNRIFSSNYFRWGAGSTALAFDGVNDVVTVPHQATLNSLPLSVTAWVKVPPGEAGGIVDKYLGSSVNGWRVIVANGRVHANYFGSASQYIGSATGNNLWGARIDDDEWHHIAFTVDSTGGALYVDGQVNAQGGWVGAPTAPTSTEPLKIGNGAGNFLAARIDDAAVWNTALSTAAISNLIATGRTAGHAQYVSVVAHWDMDVETGLTLADMSGHDHNGTLSGVPIWKPEARPILTNQTPRQVVSGTNLALDLDGLNDYVDALNGSWFSGSFTIESWVYVRNHNSHARILDFGNGPNLDNVIFALSTATNGQPYLNVVRNGSGFLMTSPVPIPVNQWVHMAATLQGIQATIYMNGAVVATRTSNVPVGAFTTNNFIGRSNYPGAGDRNADALFDDFRLWGVARTADQIRQGMTLPVDPSDPGLRVNYRFDEVSGTTVVDSRPNPRNATMVNGAGRLPESHVAAPLAGLNPGTVYHAQLVVESTNGISRGGIQGFATPAPERGTALDFDGHNDYVTVTGFGDVPAGEITVEFWMKANSLKEQGIFNLLELPTGSISLSQFRARLPRADGSVSWDWGLTPSSTLTYTPSQTLVGTWHHFAFVASVSGNTMRIFRNGILEASRPGANAAPLSRLNIGRYVESITNSFNGELDEFRVWTVARTETQIQENLNGRLIGDEPGLAAYFRMDEGSGPALVDASVNGRNGLLVNGPNYVGSTALVGVPIATTSSATNVGFGSATLKGSVNGDGTLASRYWFEYGVLSNLNQTTPTPIQSLAPNGAVEPVSATALGLQGGLLHSFRLVAANDNGTNYGAIQTFVVPLPASGYALQFDGTNYVNLGSHPALKATSALSVEAWIYPTGRGTDPFYGGIIVNKEGEYEFARFADGTLQWALAITDPRWRWTNTFVVAPSNQWMHVAFTYEGSVVRLYTNGVLASTNRARGPIDDFVPGLNELWIGQRQAGGQGFQGLIDEVRIWRTARTASDIAADYNRLLTGNEPGLVAYLHFDEGSGTATLDSSTSRFVGLLVNNPRFVRSGAEPTSPLVKTLPPSPVLATSATLNGEVNPAGDPTVIYFEYGTTDTYGSRTLSQNYAGTATTLSLSNTLTGLEPGTTYHYRMVGSNTVTFRVNYGANQSFTTLVLGSGWPVSTKLTGGEASSPVHVLDGLGNTYVAGVFSGSAKFRESLSPAGGATANAFVGKMSRAADWLWTVNIPASANGFTLIKAIALDADRNVYVAGQFSGTNTFGSTRLVSNGSTNFFVAKLETNGVDWVWARAVSSNGIASANALAVVGNRIFVAGSFLGTNNFTVTNLVSGLGSDAFVASLDSDGSWLWATPGGGANPTNHVFANTLATVVTETSTNVYVAGEYSGTVTFGTNTLASAGGSDVFVAKLTPAGGWDLVRRGGSANNDAAATLVRDGTQLYLVGQFGGTAGYGTCSNRNVGSITNIFVLNLDFGLGCQGCSEGGSGLARSAAVDASGRIYVAGDFPFDISFGTNSLRSSGNSDVFIAQLVGGNWTWAQQIGSAGTETAGSISVDSDNSVVISGTYQGTIKLGYVALSSPNERDIFVARLTPEQVFEHNNFIIGQAIPVPEAAQDPSRTDGGARRPPQIEILEAAIPNSEPTTSFYWSEPEHKLFAIRPVTAVLKWPLTNFETNLTSVITAVGRNVWPAQPQIHVAGAPVEIEGPGVGLGYTYGDVHFSTNNATVIPVTREAQQFRILQATNPGLSVLRFSQAGGNAVFEVVRTRPLFEGPRNEKPALIGSALIHDSHRDANGKNGFVYFEKAFYDGAGDERAYDRATRMGPIIPVNADTFSLDDDLVVVWYHTNANTGIGWPDEPVHYLAGWPSDADELVLASNAGSGFLEPADYPSRRVYNQPDRNQPGFNPNEEHAALYDNVLYALRNDLNEVVKVSDPFTLLKYRSRADNQWTMRVFRVVTTDTTSGFSYTGEAGQPLLLPAPLSLLPLCGASNTTSIAGFKDHVGRLYARAAGTIVAHYWYPLQPGFFYDLNLDGTPDAPVGDCLPWLDRRLGGTRDVPIGITYNISWPTDASSLQVGETLTTPRNDIPGIRDFAQAQIIFDQGNVQDTSALSSLVRIFDPLSERSVQLPDDFDLPSDIATVLVRGRRVFVDLPYAIRARLTYDPLNKRLSFGGLSDDSGAGEPLLLINVLSARERDRIKLLNADDIFQKGVDALYNLTRNPNQVDADRDGRADTDEVRIGLTTQVLNGNKEILVKSAILVVTEDGAPEIQFTRTTNSVLSAVANATTNIIHESLGDLPKALTAGPGGGSGFITFVENNDPNLAGLPVTLHVIRIDGGPFRGDLKVLLPDNIFDERLTVRHSADFGGEPEKLEFEWYYQTASDGVDPTIFPEVDVDGLVSDSRGWIRFSGIPAGANGFNDITIGDGGSESSLLTISDNWVICRYRGYSVNGQINWSPWVGGPGGERAQLAEGWIKRVLAGLDPFETRVKDFHAAPTATYASMVLQAGERYEGPVPFNPDPANLNKLGLIAAYETVLNRGRALSIDGLPPAPYSPANQPLLLAAGRIADMYMLLGNEAYADASDPTIGFTTASSVYANLAPSIFSFQNQLDSLLEEELVLLRGRDNSAASVRARPVYNRLFWNFTDSDGEVAYSQNYNISDQNADGSIDEKDARILFPQGHGDAWGHYLTAIKKYYGLLRHPLYDWKPQIETVLVAGGGIDVDYLDERKFARAAAAKAKVGAEIVNLTYRSKYVEDPAGQWQGYKDTNPERAWGFDEWARRAGSGALFDWITANAILPATDPNPTNTGIKKIDRITVTEMDEVAAQYTAVQTQVDKADGGLNPLGLATGVVPFDIDPAKVSSGQTHFDQIYQRSLKALDNAISLFNHANTLSQNLRRNQDSVEQFTSNAAEKERDHKNRLIEIFGYPYAGDIGTAGFYPSGYDGPDLLHYMYVNATDLTGENAALTNVITGYFKELDFGDIGTRRLFPDDVQADLPGSNEIFQVSFPLSDNGIYRFTAPANWGQRRAPGKLQSALADILKAEAKLKQSLVKYNNLRLQIQDTADMLDAQEEFLSTKLAWKSGEALTLTTLSGFLIAAKITAETATAAQDIGEDIEKASITTMPKVVGTATDTFAPIRGVISFAKIIGRSFLTQTAVQGKIAQDVLKEAKDLTKNATSLKLEYLTANYEIQQKIRALEQLIRTEAPARLELYELQEALQQAQGNYLNTLAQGERLLEERLNFRKMTAARTQEYRYQDMAFRIFQNDALQKYRAQFDLAALYTYLAAKAYDYETCLLGTDSGTGRKFLTDIVRQRSLGQVVSGQPVSGSQGLADPLARLSQNFEVYRGQLGFTTPETETGRFSLRNELMRLRGSSDAEWRAELQKGVVDDLWSVPEFRRFCRPFAPESAGPQPGLVIRFPTTITFGLNYFGFPLGGGDSAYDPSRFATKVRSVGVWFSNYDVSGLSLTPRVYLVPAGQDILRSPSGSTLETREWTVVDQKLPVPFPIGASDLKNPAWIPGNDSLSETFADIRRFSTFRAYHDSGFKESEATVDTRLIGRSVWNTDWMLIIPGGTFRFDADQGLETFIDSVSDIKIFFQTYAYSGN